MTRASEFVVQKPKRRAPLSERPRKPQPPKIDIEHRILGIGRLMGLRPSGSGGFVCDVKFGSTTRTLKLEQPYWITLVADVLALMPMFPASKPPVEKEWKKSVAEDEEPETEELSAERAFRGDGDGEDSDEAEADGESDGVLDQEIV